MEDFWVEELRPKPLSGDGEHWIVRLEKRDMTTDQLAHQLAKRVGISRGDVGYAGLKDRQGVTLQDFSLHLPGKELPKGWQEGLPAGVVVRDIGRDRRKIKPGMLSGNAFTIRLRGCGVALAEEERAQSVRLIADEINQFGVPNFFGPQRFGRDGDNVAEGLKQLRRGRKGRRGDRHKRGILLSAVRSDLFNRLLAARMQEGLFKQLLPGDVAQLAGRTGAFLVEDFESEHTRFEAKEIHPSGPLFGSHMLLPEGRAGEMERSLMEQESETIELLEKNGMKGARRALRLFPSDFGQQWEGSDLILTFTLPRGCYATSVVREFLK
uniref:tRNA pseudouridine synthase D n=1 Tax=Magnetococcus massalia (strain MO-1) TaxID=451514 RepID=A0A1S7LP87_MAGMO|nr:tRNA pseudouridine synthase D [Candidatus Magnetococcus massalia]